MNSKFFDVNKEKQDSIINAALKLFAQKGYKDASTDIIVKRAGISKGLLFHYFLSKQGLYEFICNYSSKYMSLELTRTVKSNDKDFFEIMSHIEMAKMRVARNYPYMQSFLRSIRFEKDEEALQYTQKALGELEVTYSNIYAQINPKNFIYPEYSEKVIKMIEWINDGFCAEKLNEEDGSLEERYEEFSQYLTILRSHFYKSEEDKSISIAKEEVFERDETVMDDIKMEMTFEERLMAGKRPLVDIPVDENTSDESDKEENSDVSDMTDKTGDKATNEDEDVNNSDKSDEISHENDAELLEEREEDEWLDEADEEIPSAADGVVPMVNTGSVISTPIIPVMQSQYSSGNEEDIIREAEANIANNEAE